MADYVQTWRRRLRLKQLIEVAQSEIKSGKRKEEIYKTLDLEMQNRWNLVLTTRKQYLVDINRILTGQYVLGA